MISGFSESIRQIYLQRYVLFSIAKLDVSNRYKGSLLGLSWTVLNPLVKIAVFWFVFSVGFKVKPTNDVPFVVWLTAGMAVWLIFADILTGSVGVILSNASLVRRTTLDSQILPFAKLLSSLFNHAVFLFLLLALLKIQGMPFSLFYFQSLYYLFGLSALALGMAWLASALNVFLRDVGEIVGVFLQLCFWATPIFWDIRIMPEKVQLFLKLNPLYYLVRGYRDSFIYFDPFWRHPYEGLYFWTITALLLFSGAVFFRRLKPHFAEVL